MLIIILFSPIKILSHKKPYQIVITATCIINQYDFKTGTNGVISGSKKLSIETNKITEASTIVAAKPPNDFLVNKIPARVEVQAMYIIDS